MKAYEIRSPDGIDALHLAERPMPEPGPLAQTIVDGFKQPMGTPDAPTDQATTMAIAHGVRFVLVDPARGVRGLYETDELGLDRLVRDAARLVEGLRP